MVASVHDPALAHARSARTMRIDHRCATLAMATIRSELIYADDDEHVRAALAMALESRGIVVHQCRNGLEALDLCREIRPVLMLLDLDMPVLDGYETARRVRAEQDIAGTRLVAISGSCDRFTGERASGAGFDQVLCKPVTLATLMQAVEA